MKSVFLRNPPHWPRLANTRRANMVRGLLFISPWLVGLVVFKLAPILASLGLSLTNFKLLTPQETQFVGSLNYTRAFEDEDAWVALLQSVRLMLVFVPLQTIAAIALATLLSSPRLRFKNTMRALFFLPSIIPSVAAMFMWQGFINPTSGWLGRLILDPLGLDVLDRLSGWGGRGTMSLVGTLWAIGPGFLIMMAAMQGISPEILEAAMVDGAGRLRRFFSITLPLISPAIFFTLFINLTATFGGAMLLDRGHTLEVTNSSLDSYIHYVLFRLFRLGYASSLAWIFFVLVMVIVLVLFVSSKKWVYYPDGEEQA